jgi:CheY-like chemotaxis protein
MKSLTKRARLPRKIPSYKKQRCFDNKALTSVPGTGFIYDNRFSTKSVYFHALQMRSTSIHILLADDDKDDCLLFREALDELPFPSQLTTVNNGEELMTLLQKKALPSMLFLDLNMPRKNGFECLAEIRQDERLKRLSIIIISTSFDQEIVKLLHANGASYYIRKPQEFETLKKVIHKAVSLVSGEVSKTDTDNFVLHH